jgi:protein-tyrosine phosphatase
MGNICRSPTAHGVFRQLIEDNQLTDVIEIDSAGTHAYHVGNPPDSRALETGRRRGLDFADLRARQVVSADFEEFDYVLAMDKDNFRGLKAICPEGFENRLKMFMEFAPQLRIKEVPDPYYGGPSGFERVYDMIEAAAYGLLQDIRKTRL